MRPIWFVAVVIVLMACLSAPMWALVATHMCCRRAAAVTTEPSFCKFLVEGLVALMRHVLFLAIYRQVADYRREQDDDYYQRVFAHRSSEKAPTAT
jgi:hypothetical protein